MQDAQELWDPIRRLKYIDGALEPSLTVIDRIVAARVLDGAMQQLHAVHLAVPLLDDRLTLDGTRRELIVRSGQWMMRLTWSSLPESLDPLETWWEQLRDELQKVATQ